MKNLENDIFSISGEQFEQKALEIFNFQYKHNPVYNQFARLLNKTPEHVKTIEDIPFLPVEFFKTHQIVSAPSPYDKVFFSSGTTGMQRSKHYIKNIKLYEHSFLKAFEHFYGPVTSYAILGLLPSYLEQKNSSLIYMVRKLMEYSAHPLNGFFLYNHDELAQRIEKLEKAKQKTILIGVSYALLDFFTAHPLQLQHTIVMETGGMKGRRKEMVREELHQILMKQTGLRKIHSEYGMTELLSQAYSKGEGKFQTPPWMKILIRDPEDPLSNLPPGKTGGINIIDLANLHSCSFLMTSDLGKIHPTGTFEVSGRFDNSDIRGCNLMVVE